MRKQKYSQSSISECLNSINKIADRLEARKHLRDIAESMCIQNDVKELNLLQSENDRTTDCPKTEVAHTCQNAGFGCGSNHSKDGNFRCHNQYSCPSQASFDCNGFSCRGPEPGIVGVGTSSFNCDTQQSFRCGGATFVCTQNHQCGGSASQQPDRNFSCTNNVRCHAGNTGNDGFGCGGTNSSSAFNCGVDAAGTDNNVFDCQYGFRCFAKAEFTCEQRTSFQCRGNAPRAVHLLTDTDIILQ